MTQATVGEIFRKVGDAVKADESLLELETDKAAQEIPSPVTGVIRELLVKQGDDVEVGALLLRIEEGAAASGADAGGRGRRRRRRTAWRRRRRPAPARCRRRARRLAPERHAAVARPRRS